MDDLREKLAKLHGVAWTQPTGEVTITFDPGTNDAQLAFDAVMAVKDEAMLEPAPLGRINEEALDGPAPEIDAPIRGSQRAAPLDRAEILRRGVVLDDIDGDTMTHVMDKLGWPRPGHPMGKVATHVLTPIRRAERDYARDLALSFMEVGDQDDAEGLAELFRRAIQAGYDAARVLDPGTIYLDQAPTREQERVAAGLSSDFTSPRVPSDSAWQPTDDAMPINPVEDAIMPELRNALYDETAAIAEAAGEGMGVAGEKPE